MAGCFGNHPVDRWIEQQLHDYLNDSELLYCDRCGFESWEDDFDYDEEIEKLICPDCGNIIEL